MSRMTVFLQDLAATVGPPFFKMLMVTLRWRLIGLYKDRKVHLRYGPVIWAFWHNAQAFVGHVGRNRGARVLISIHHDGEYVARLMMGMGYDPVRGSSTRGGAPALLELASTETTQDFAITPDGPRGPRGHVHPGIIMLAQATGRPIMPIGATATPCIRLHGWDRFIVPYPFATVGGVIGDPIFVPHDADADERETCRTHLEEVLEDLTRRAEEACRRSPAGTTRHLGSPFHRHGFG